MTQVASKVTSPDDTEPTVATHFNLAAHTIDQHNDVSTMTYNSVITAQRTRAFVALTASIALCGRREVSDIIIH